MEALATLQVPSSRARRSHPINAIKCASVAGRGQRPSAKQKSSQQVHCELREAVVRSLHANSCTRAADMAVVQYRALQGGWNGRKLSGNDKLSGLGGTRVNNCTVLIFNYSILFS